MENTDLAALERQLNAMILEGKLLEALDRFYADDCVMQENLEEPCVGKAANRAREQQFLANCQQVHAVELYGGAVGDGVTYSEWLFDLTFRGDVRVATTQVAARRWRDGLVVHERFYYKPAR